MTDINEKVNMSEALARSIRDELRQHNDDNEPVLLLVRKVVSDLAAKASETCERFTWDEFEGWLAANGEIPKVIAVERESFREFVIQRRKLTETKHKEEGK